MITAKFLKAKLTLSGEVDAIAVEMLRGLKRFGDRTRLVERAVVLGQSRYKINSLDAFAPRERAAEIVKPERFYLWIYPQRTPQLANMWVAHGRGSKEIHLRTLFRIGFALLEGGEDVAVEGPAPQPVPPPTNVSPTLAPGGTQMSKLARLEAGWNT